MKQHWIELVTTKGKFPCLAYDTKCPNLFIHKDINDGRSSWTISHTPTGRKILSNIPKKIGAVKACEIMSHMDGWGNLNTDDEKRDFFKRNYEQLVKARDTAYRTFGI